MSRIEKTEKTILLNARITPETEEIFYKIWDMEQDRMPHRIRVRKQDVFSIVIEGYYKHLTECEE